MTMEKGDYAQQEVIITLAMASLTLFLQLVSGSMLGWLLWIYAIATMTSLYIDEFTIGWFHTAVVQLVRGITNLIGGAISLLIIYGAVMYIKSNALTERLLNSAKNPVNWGTQSFLSDLIDLYQNLNNYGSFVYLTLFFLGHIVIVSAFRAAINVIVIGFNLSMQAYESLAARH